MFNRLVSNAALTMMFHPFKCMMLALILVYALGSYIFPDDGMTTCLKTHSNAVCTQALK